MMHRNTGVRDEPEEIASTDTMTIKRIRMDSKHELGDLSSGPKEVLVVVMKGGAVVSVGPRSFILGEKDLCYVPRDESFSMAKKDSNPNEVVLLSAPANSKHPPFVKRFAETTPIESGSAPYKRKIYNMVTETDKADRFLCGFVEGESGNWTSFPPHRHDGKPEVYIYYGMNPKFGVQMVLTDGKDESFVVRDGDAVLFERGYHPNVAAPGTGMNFLWVISAPPERRDLSVEFHPDFHGMQSGATHLKTNVPSND
jgi:5-deoxy-glucuronate isomerase